MTTKFRTLLLLGLTGLAGLLPGCILETTDNSSPGPGYGPGPSSCLASQYFEVDWLMDNGVGTARQPCGALPNTSVELVLASGTTYVVDGLCDEAFKYNWSGFTQSGVAAGDYVTRFRLLRTDTGTVLSPGGSFPGSSSINPAIPACAPVTVAYEFPLM